MPRSIGFLADQFDTRTAEVLQFVGQLEANKLAYPAGAGALDVNALELTYELAFLKVFGLWEQFLEESFLRLLCGYARSGAREPLQPGESYSPQLAHAEARMLGTRNYVAWYVPSDIVGRTRRYFLGSNFEFVIASATTILLDQSLIRHRIAHVQPHAKAQFDAMTMRMEGRRFPGSRPGKFLRLSRTTDHLRWLEFLSRQLSNLAGQIAR